MYFSPYLPKQPSCSLGFLWPSGEIFYKSWLPLEHQKLFPRSGLRPSFSCSTHTALHRLKKKPVSRGELFFSHREDVCQKNGLLVTEKKRKIFFKPILFQTLFKDISKTLGGSYYSLCFSDEPVICSRSYN